MALLAKKHRPSHSTKPSMRSSSPPPVQRSPAAAAAAPPPSPRARLSEQQVIAGFHSILRDSLAQARGEGLLTDDEISTGDVDVQIGGPALALFFAALGSSGTPPAIVAPDSSFSLTGDTCPASFESFFRLWQAAGKEIKRLGSDDRYDLALILCDKEPRSSPIQVDVVRLAGDLKAVAIEITQRRTFQTRYAGDLQRALESGVRPRTSQEGEEEQMTVQFQPPPEYSPPDLSAVEEAQVSGRTGRGGMRAPLGSAVTEEHNANLAVIRETLYSALGDAIATNAFLLELTARGPTYASRAFFASTSLAILQVALDRVTVEGVRPVNLGRASPQLITPRECPAYLRPFLGKLVEVAGAARAIAEEDDERAMQDAADGRPSRGSNIDHLKQRLALGAEQARGGPTTREDDERVNALANEVNALALKMASLPAFEERQMEAWKVLSAISSL